MVDDVLQGSDHGDRAATRSWDTRRSTVASWLSRKKMDNSSARRVRPIIAQLVEGLSLEPSGLRYLVAVSSTHPVGQQGYFTILPEPQSDPDNHPGYYESITNPLPQRQQRFLTPPPALRPPSSVGTSPRSLRRTPRLQERRPIRPHSPPPPPPVVRFSPPPRSDSPQRRSRPPPAEVDIHFGSSGSTTPESFQRLVQTDSYWPRRSTHISRHTHEAILYTLEAIRTGNGVDAEPLTRDLLEEGARMSDLLASNAPSGAAGGSRVQNGSSRPAPGPVNATTGQTRFRTPTAVMAERRLREQRKEQEAAQRRIQEEERRQQMENVVGVGDDRRQTSGRPPLTEIQPGAAPGTTSVTASRRRTEPNSTSNGSNVRIGSTTAPNQPKPASSLQQSQVIDPTAAGQISRNRTEALEKLEMPATAEPNPPQPQGTTYATQPAPTAQQSQRTGFPHAFQRWEDLSSQWEGHTAYWIRRLEGNREELNGKPIDQQMAREIMDLSAAGANLFHAVVELQRLRASSERKFQRWYFLTREEQEQAKERVAELERQLLYERENPSTAALESAKAEKAKADELVREMRRELQISKEEARRAWEELGRREQEEREHTIALRSGEPTLIGGVQVVPMAGLSSRYLGASSRPQTRGGPIPGGPGPTQMSGQQQQQQQQQSQPREAFSRSQTTLESPEREQTRFTYQQGQTSPTETDPFTEIPWNNQPQQTLRHEPDTQFYQSPSHSQSQAGSGLAPPRSVASPTRAQTQSTSPSRFYQGPSTSTAVYQPLTSTAAPQRPVTAGSDNRSYIPSTASGSGSGEEYHINPDGTYTRDAQGRRILSNQPISGPGVEEEEIREGEEEQELDDDDYTDDVERERMYAQQYSQRQAAVSQPPRTAVSVVPPTTATAAQRTTTIPTTQTYASPASRSYSTTNPATSQPMTQPVSSLASEGYDVHRDDDIPGNIVTGWEGIQVGPRHHHPSRLSAIMEERSGRTTPSRQSYASESLPGGQRTGGNNNNNQSAPYSRSFNLE